jgi:hypothetical protein
VKVKRYASCLFLHLSFSGMDVIRVLVREEVDVKMELWRKEMGEVEVVGFASLIFIYPLRTKHDLGTLVA